MKKLLLAVMAGATRRMAQVAFVGPGSGDPAPDFTLPDTAYVNHSLSDFTDKVVMLNFWALW